MALPKIDTDVSSRNIQRRVLAVAASRSMFSDVSNSIPGVDEAMSFAELMKMVQNMNFSCIVFDTAPTGHTLRLLSFPTIMDKALSKLMDLKNKFSGLFSQFGSMFGGGGVSEEVRRIKSVIFCLTSVFLFCSRMDGTGVQPFSPVPWHGRAVGVAGVALLCTPSLCASHVNRIAACLG